MQRTVPQVVSTETEIRALEFTAMQLQWTMNAALVKNTSFQYNSVGIVSSSGTLHPIDNQFAKDYGIS